MASLDPPAALERLGNTARDLVALLGTARGGRLRRAPEGGGWSPAEVVSHLADAELVYSVRMRLAVTSDRPFLPAYDEAAWVRRFTELDSDPKESLSRWRALRQSNLRLLESLAPEEWRLTGVDSDMRELSVARMAELLVDHDRQHLAQIRAGLAED
ncbi:MAG: DinB family protein [Actinobacteria bacterium]|nr:DinB family protein [Actinomycetota bacterium]MBW3650539.1 DinB family protein [Actinomycetota bacterium]